MLDRFFHPQNQIACYNLTTLLSYNCCSLVSHTFIWVWDVIRHQWRWRFSSRDCQKKITFPWKFIVSVYVTIKMKRGNFFPFWVSLSFFTKLFFDWSTKANYQGIHFILLTSMKNQAWEYFSILGLTVFFYKFIFWLVYKCKIDIDLLLLTSMEKCFHFSFYFLLIITRISYIIINFPWNYFNSKNESRKISHQPESNHEPLV